MKTKKFAVIIGMFAILALAFVLGSCKTETDGGGDTQTEKTVVRLRITTEPTKKNYAYGESLDTTGMVVEATYSDGTTDGNVTDYTTEGYNATPAQGGEQTITVKFGGKTATFKVTVTAINQVVTPTASPSASAGPVTKGTKVTLSTTTAGADIYYTTDGADPTASSTKYNDAAGIIINTSTTIKAIAVKANMSNSSVMTEAYSTKVATPTANPPAGEVESGRVVKLSSTEGAAIYYTTDGTTTPTTSSTLYVDNDGITLTVDTTIKAYAVKTNMDDSDVLTAAYTVVADNTVPRPTVTPAAGAITTGGAEVELECSDEEADIYYTTDGTDPEKDTGTTVKYTGPIYIDSDITIKAIAVKDTMNDSSITEAAYTVSYDTVVAFRVNAAGDGFTNIGTGGSTYEALQEGPPNGGLGNGSGTFITSGGLKVFNTGGTQDGQWKIPWSNPSWTGYWPRYINVATVHLGTSGDIVGTSDNWTVEVIFALAEDHGYDMVDQYIWVFSADSIDGSYKFPGENMIGFCWREMYERIRKGDVGADYGFGVADNWVAGNPYREEPKSKWAHLVTTKDSTGKITNYLNGVKMNENTLTNFPKFDTDRLNYNFFGRSIYINPWDLPVADLNTVYGNDLAKAGLYHFAIDNTAWDDTKVASRYNNSAVGKGVLTTWTP